MRYYVMEPIGNVLLPTIPKGAEVVISSDLNRFREIDYDARSKVISERLKLIMGLYMPKYRFEPVVYLEPVKGEEMIFWHFKPPLYTDYQAVFRNDGIVSHISLQDNRAPIIFTVRSPKGTYSIIVKMAVAESVLRRGILGLRFTKISAAADALDV